MLDPTLAGEGETDLVGHSAAEGALGWGWEGKGHIGEVWPCNSSKLPRFLPSLC